MTPYALPLFAGAVVLVGIAVQAWRKRSMNGARILLAMSLGLLLYVLGYAMELGSTTLPAVRLWLVVEYVGVFVGINTILLLAMIYNHRPLTSMLLPIRILFFLPIVSIFFALTNDTFGMIWQDMQLINVGRAYLLDFTPGPWYWVNMVYIWLVMIASLLLGVRALVKAQGLYRRQVVVMLAGLCLPLVTYLIYLFMRQRVHIDLNPYALTGTALLLAWGMFDVHLMDIMPAAREAILASMSDLVIVLDDRGRLVEINRAAVEALDVDPHFAIGRHSTEVLAGWPDVLRSLEVPADGIGELRLKIKGDDRFYDLRVSPLWASKEALAGRLLIMRDITEMAHAQNALQRANKRLTVLREVDTEISRKLDVSYVLEVTLSAGMSISQADGAAIGLAEEDGIRLVHAKGLYPESVIGLLVPRGPSIADRVFRTRVAELNLDVHTDPDYYEVVPGMQAQITVPLLSGEKLIGALVLETADPTRFTTDVFDTVKLLATRVAVAIDNAAMYEERDRLARELEAFAHTVAHDLKNPLNVISGYADLTLQAINTLNESEIKENLNNILISTIMAGEIIDALLLLSGVRMKQHVEIGPVPMGEVVHITRHRLSRQLAQSGAELNAPASWPLVMGYAPWVGEVWANYLSNAIKFGGKPPRIEMGWDAARDGVLRFWVQDNGAGITSEDRDKLFRPFTRLDEHQTGHGLGLSIVRRIVERLGGEVGVESEPGQGSRFYFTLPAAQISEIIPS